MDLSVEPENVPKVLQTLREFIKEHLLPRLSELEEEVRLLRKVTWPVCQNIRESTQLDDIKCKREFLQNLDPDEVRMLLKRKSKGLLVEEYNQLNLPILQEKYY
jgi:hypothetical protein